MSPSFAKGRWQKKDCITNTKIIDGYLKKIITEYSDSQCICLWKMHGKIVPNNFKYFLYIKTVCVTNWPEIVIITMNFIKRLLMGILFSLTHKGLHIYSSYHIVQIMDFFGISPWILQGKIWNLHKILN